MVHAPAVGGSASNVLATTSIRDSPINGTLPNGAPQARTGRMGATSLPNGGPNAINAKPLSAQKAQRLDMSSVERRGASTMAKELARPSRLFGLQEAPTFRPTEEEFRNPIEYIRSIADHGKKFGIVKIIPPDEWNPDFAINTEVRLSGCQNEMNLGCNELLTSGLALPLSHETSRTQHRRRWHSSKSKLPRPARKIPQAA